MSRLAAFLWLALSLAACTGASPPQQVTNDREAGEAEASSGVSLSGYATIGYVKGR